MIVYNKDVNRVNSLVIFVSKQVVYKSLAEGCHLC
jgi:hypothetical protein